jgi:hypothetical protein
MGLTFSQKRLLFCFSQYTHTHAHTPQASSYILYINADLLIVIGFLLWTFVTEKVHPHRHRKNTKKGTERIYG